MVTNGDFQATALTMERKGIFWMKAAAWCFGLWAAMLPLSATIVMSMLRDVNEEQIKMTHAFTSYREAQERRLTAFEERQAFVLRMITELQRDIDENHPRRRNERD